MKKIIRHIRKQPEEVRRHILHAATLGLAVILFFLWVFSLGRNFTNEETRQKASEDLKPFSALRANLVDGYKSMTAPDFYPEQQ